MYELQLTTIDVSGQTASVAVNVVVTGQMNVGDFRLTFTDAAFGGLRVVTVIACHLAVAQLRGRLRS